MPEIIRQDKIKIDQDNLHKLYYDYNGIQAVSGDYVGLYGPSMLRIGKSACGVNILSKVLYFA